LLPPKPVIRCNRFPARQRHGFNHPQSAAGVAETATPVTNVAPDPAPGKRLFAPHANYCTKITRIYRDFTKNAAATV
jgi:hypothetical protein